MTSDSDLAPYEMVIQDAVNKVMAGQNADQVLEALLSQLPAYLREAIRRKFQVNLVAAQRLVAMTPEEREQQKSQQQGKVAQVVFTLATAASLIAQGTFNKIQALMNARADIRNAILREGMLLKSRGVTPDTTQLDNEILGNLTPSLSKDQVKDKGPISR